ncbi:hypothetical protein IAT38_003379 [Cryptococcus sp. DSM 104549]
MMTSILTTMKALVVPHPGVEHYALKTQPVPKPSRGKVLLRIRASGLCHTDTMVLKGEFGGNYPLVGGHEPAGEVVKLGEGVTKVKEGDRVVALLPKDPCGKCADCTIGDWKYCPKISFGGINADGYFSEYALVESRFCVPIPDDMSYDQAAPMSCAGVTVYTGIKKAQLKPGDVIAISGVGALGYLGVQMAKALGLKVVAIDARPRPLDLSRSLPPHLAPDLVINAKETSAEDAVKQIVQLRPEGYVGWDGIDATILTSPSPASYPYAAALTRSHGLMIILAQPSKLEFDYPTFLARDITLKGSLHGNEVDLRETVELAHKFGIRSEVKRFTVDEHEAMVDALEGEGWRGKAVLVFD